MNPEQVIIQEVSEFFDKQKINFDKNKTCHSLLIQYFNYRLRYIATIPRQSRVSAELSNKLNSHPAKDVIFEIFTKTSKGQNLNPHQSKLILNEDYTLYNDLLFNDWGIHHLHLGSGEDLKNPKFRARSSSLVYVKFTSTIAYFIDILEHDNWGNSDLVKIMTENWPRMFQAKKVGWLWPRLPDKEIYSLRKKGYSLGVNVGDDGYISLGHGHAFSGDNRQAVYMANDVVRWVGGNLELFSENREVFKRQLLQQLGL